MCFPEVEVDGAVSTLKKNLAHKQLEVRAAGVDTYTKSWRENPQWRPRLVAGLPLLLEKSRDRPRVVKAIKECMKTVGETVHPSEVRPMWPIIVQALTHLRDASKLIGLELLSALTKRAPEFMSQLLPLCVPAVLETVHDINAEVQESSRAVFLSLAQTISNRDVLPFVPVLVTGLIDPSEAGECIQKLAGTTFVQTIDSPTLSLLEPILIRGFATEQRATVRMCAVIIENMASLVVDPQDVGVFVPKILPGLERASEVTADPECREVCGRAVAALQRVVAEAEQVTVKAVDYDKQIPSEVVAPYREWVAGIAQSLANVEADNWSEPLNQWLSEAEITSLKKACAKSIVQEEEAMDIDPALILCDCQFTLAYGSKILLRETKLKLIQGRRYGLIGPNGSGKSTLMNSMITNQIDGFPTDLRSVFVSCDIAPEHAELNVVDFCCHTLTDVPRERIVEKLTQVGFTDAMKMGKVDCLSGGWKMKLALARAMLQDPQILLLDEPTNHLDVSNVSWVVDYLTSLQNVTSIIVSHDAAFMDRVCTDIIQCDHLRLRNYHGHLSDFHKVCPEARAYSELKASSRLEFILPEPRGITGVKSKGKPLLTMKNCEFTYPGTEKQILHGISICVSMLSRCAVIGPNGAGKSTMIKLLTGELEPNKGEVWKHPELVMAYVAQHAFHHIESHLEKTATEYILWRYCGGIDKEAITKAALIPTDEELKQRDTPFMYEWLDAATGKLDRRRTKVVKLKSRRLRQRVYQYEVDMVAEKTLNSNVWVAQVVEDPIFLSRAKLDGMGWGKECQKVDDRDASQGMRKVLSQAEVEKHLKALGMPAEFASHTRMSSLSTSQRVKVVIAAAMWDCPHIMVLDEPTNYLDRESLGALADAIRKFGGGVVMISHNAEFTSALCGEQWAMDGGKLHVYGEVPEANDGVKLTEIAGPAEMIDEHGNTVVVKQKKAELTRKEKKARALRRKNAGKDPNASSTDDEW